MRKHIVSFAVAAALVAGAALSAFADAVASPGKQSAYASVSGQTFGPTPAIIPGASVTIAKGKKKRTLEVDVTAIVPSVAAGQTINVLVYANGLLITEPLASIQAEHGCSPSVINCTAQGTFWLDLDAAEAANPGLFANVPIVIDAEVSTASITGPSGIVSVRARLVKK